MIPLADENENRIMPYVTYVLIALNVLAYIIDRVGANGPIGALWNYSMIPASVVHNAPVPVDIPVMYGNMVRQVQMLHTGLNPQWLTIFTSMFMHGGLMHIGGNMLYLWIFGDNIEQVLGHVKFGVFYFATGVLAALAHIWSDPGSIIPTVGASGAIAGVLGAYLMLFPGNRVRTLIMLGFFWDVVEIPAVFVLGVWFLIQLTGTLGSGGLQGGGVAYWAHVGGFVSGIVLVFVLGGRRPPRTQLSYRQQRGDGLSPWEE